MGGEDYEGDYIKSECGRLEYSNGVIGCTL